MKSKFMLVLFKNKEYFKKLKNYKQRKYAVAGYKRFIDRCDLVKFPVGVVNGRVVEYEIALLEKNPKRCESVYIRDEMGRQIKQTVDDEDYNIIKIAPYYIEEKFLDKELGRKITTELFIKKYLNVYKFKTLTKLNNKIIYESGNECRLFVFKNSNEVNRFMDCLWKILKKDNRMDIVMLKDFTTKQRYEMYERYTAKGFSLAYLKDSSVR
jgi:hypothetical protein